MGLKPEQLDALKAELSLAEYAGLTLAEIHAKLHATTALVTFPSRIEVLFGDDKAIGPRELDEVLPQKDFESKGAVVRVLGADLKAVDKTEKVTGEVADSGGVAELEAKS